MNKQEADRLTDFINSQDFNFIAGLKELPELDQTDLLIENNQNNDY